MKKKLRKILLIVFLLFPHFIIPVTADKEGYYYIKAEIPENQVDRNKSYFDLLVEPGQIQTLYVQVLNISNKAIEVVASINNAATNTNGTIMYTVHGIKDDSMVFSIEDIATIKESKFILDANSSTFLEIELNVPIEAFQGTILGGICVQAEYVEKEEVVNNSSSIQIENKLTYVIGLQLREDLSTTVIPNINYLSTKPLLHNISSAVGIRIQNSEPIIMKGVIVEAEIYKANSDKVLYQFHGNAVEIAPNSAFDIAVVWGNERLQAGTYRLKLRVQYEKHQWTWEEEFIIERDKIGEINEQAVNIDRSFPTWIYYLLGIIICLIIVVLAFILGQKSAGKKRRN